MPADNEGAIPGEVISSESGRITVRLDTGEVGQLAPSPEGGLEVGYRGLFRIEERNPGGGLSLSLAQPDENAPSPAFDREFTRLRNALANHRPSPIPERTPKSPLGEEQMEEWIERVGQAVARLRKRRAKRLNDRI